MKTNMNRRNFLMTAGATAGFAIASGYSPFSYAQNEKVRVGCIGTGGQGTFHIRDGLTGTPDIEIVAVCDVFLPHQREAIKLAQLANAGITITPEKRLTDEEKQMASAATRPNAYYDYKEMLEKEELDAVVIATPLATHFPITMDCLNAGKWVFCEKTLVKTIEEGRDLITRCHELGRWVQVGHQRRYNPKYNMAMGLAYDDNMIGRITHITAQWHRNHYWRRVLPKDYVLNDEEKKFITDLEHHLNWRIYADSSEGLFTELATHQTDISNWFLKKVPSRVHAFGGLDYWRDGRTTDDNILLAFEYEESSNDPGFMPIDQRSQFQKLRELSKPYTVRSVYSSILANAKRGASELIQGDRGTFELTEGKCLMFGEDVVTQKDEGQSAEEMAAATTAGSTRQVSTEELLNGKELLADVALLTPDVYQFRAFANCIKNGGVPRSNQMVGFTTAITAIAAIKSRREGGVVEIDPSWYSFDFEVPSFYDFGKWEEEIS
ncbi:MAG TPA: Gfo/Idh/MocA family oxidoreductase [Candidatus Hydrogenedentes bacterium]|mgnify:CR=1 FL=1|jgi:predicted dehydrogenase|nr:MAG: Inositol 2-dehydrogenase [Candidatus Hydrogenedentes bacterium ADurb.Bin170]HNZ49212.1 Gfo/Idh/MocA family oxidoreductase [Candidatus Hydrogenedentota bacterium]HOD96217.1 Gfo/Idh/MocA family oxidoreductase [Candidatus Hydrogenedentota bacterium]HOR51680.1 Gfo/Idh/MocA family oxidoreductase [Candidatus Hydrogenedentota bacterium]HPK25567.1 Gfo/Idh/MocA family oxidoreductase [Candidatus Hydrogenedentota bacterium]